MFTTFPASKFPPEQVLGWDRTQWQVEVIFKFIAQLGHLPKYNPKSAKAWLDGKLLTALLTERLIYHEVAMFLSGHDLHSSLHAEPVAGVHVPSNMSGG